MRISCPNCPATYNVSDSKLAGRKSVKLRCKRCNTVFESPTQPELEPQLDNELDALFGGAGSHALDDSRGAANPFSAPPKRRPSISTASTSSIPPASFDSLGPARPEQEDPTRVVNMSNVDDDDSLAGAIERFTVSFDAESGRDGPSPATDHAYDFGGDDFGGRSGPGGRLDSGDEDPFAHGVFGDDDAFEGAASLDFSSDHPSVPELGAPNSLGINVSDESQLLDIALLSSGLDEPAEPEKQRPVVDSAARKAVQDESQKSRLIRLDIAGDARRRRQAGGSTWIASLSFTFALLVIGVASAMVYVASKNDWILDFKQFDQMLGVAFEGETFEPRHQKIIRVYDSDGTWIEEEVAELPETAPDELQPAEVVTGRYRTESGTEFLIVEGGVLNASDGTYRNITLDVALSAEDGELLAEQTVVAGQVLEQPTLEGIDSHEALSAALTTAAEQSLGVEVAAGELARFRAVFLLPEDDDAYDDASYEVLVHEGERHRPQACWSAIQFARDQDEFDVALDGAADDAAADDAEADDAEELSP